MLVFLIWEGYHYVVEGGNVNFYVQDERSKNYDEIRIKYKDDIEDIKFENDQTIVLGNAYDDFSFGEIIVYRNGEVAIKSKTFPIVQWIVIDLFDDSTNISLNFSPILLQ